MAHHKKKVVPRRVRRNTGNVTLADVAKIAGVAPITASRALAKPNLVSAETLERVRAAVERTNYVPNLIAGGLASSRSDLVVAIVPTVSSPMFAATIETLTDCLREAGYQMMVGLSGYSTAREDDILKTVLSRRPAGVVLTGAVHSAEGRRRLLAAKIPVVETWDLTPTPIGMVVGFSSEKIGAEVARFFHARGSRRVAVLTGDDRRARNRAEGFIQQAVALGLGEVPLLSVPAPSVIASGRAGIVELLRRHPEIDAVACSSDVLALGVLIEAQARNIAVPHDLAVIGFGDLNVAAAAHPALTTVQIDGAAIGRHAARYILDTIDGRPVKNHVVDVGFTIVQRETT